MAEQTTPTYDDGARRAGDVVIINLLNALEDPNTKGKRRPAVLIRRQNGHWATMGLTTNPRYRDGTPRVSIPSPGGIGLRSPGWLWGNRLANVSVLDIGHRVGHVDRATAEAIVDLAQLDDDDAAALRLAASDPENDR